MLTLKIKILIDKNQPEIKFKIIKLYFELNIKQNHSNVSFLDQYCITDQKM